jgi:hypothetical protein
MVGQAQGRGPRPRLTHGYSASDVSCRRHSGKREQRNLHKRLTERLSSPGGEAIPHHSRGCRPSSAIR